MVDLAGPGQALVVEVDASPVYELVLGLLAFTMPEGQHTLEIGQDWTRQARERVSPELLDALERLGLPGRQWAGLLRPARQAGPFAGVRPFLDWVAGADPLALRRHLLDGPGCEPSPPAADLGPVVLRDLVAQVLARWHREVMAELLPGLEPALERDAAATRGLAGRLGPEAVVETATKGMRYAGEVGVDRILLIPTVVLRPWVLNLRWGGTKVLCHPVADESLDPDAGRPPQRLLKLYRALGDERRLAILRQLAGGPATLQQVADHQGLAKSTAHHHIGILRAAGVLAIGAGDQDKAYSLRRRALDASDMLERYLS